MKEKNGSRRPLAIFLALALTALMAGNSIAIASGPEGREGKARRIVDPIRTDAGYISGTLVGEVGKEVRIYRGIPYAAPPLGSLRWRPPQPAPPWSGIRECTVLSKWPPQKFPTLARYGGIPEAGMSEDCLYLNVLTPAKRTTDRLPVLVWFHGGGYNAQSGSRASYNQPPLAQHGVVLVTVSHRLGAIGYLAHPLLTAESRMKASGNYGQLDLIAALKWVQNNIGAFGGDPKRVTIFGESGGGYKVTWLMVSPLAKGLFHAAIAQSGVADGKSLKDSEQMGVNLAKKLGVSGAPDGLATLRAKSWKEIINASLAPDSGFTADVTVDGWSLLDTIPNTFKAGKQNDVPFIIGITEKDIPSIYTATVKVVPNIKPGQSKTYAYLFTHVPAGWKLDGCKAYHSLDVGYVFGQPRLMAPGNYEGYAVAAGAKQPDPGFDERDDWMTEFMVSRWIQFAATGDPNFPSSTPLEGTGTVPWPAYKADTDLYLDIRYPPGVKSGFSKLVEP